MGLPSVSPGSDGADTQDGSGWAVERRKRAPSCFRRSKRLNLGWRLAPDAERDTAAATRGRFNLMDRTSSPSYVSREEDKRAPAVRDTGSPTPAIGVRYGNP